MDSTERELFHSALRRAAESHTGAALDEAWRALAWHEALAADTPSAVSLLFEHQGRAGVTSSALDDVVGFALGLDPATAPSVILPGLDGSDPPGALVRGRVGVTGVGSARLAVGHTAVVVCGGNDDELVSVDTAGLTRRRVTGMDPALGLVVVSGDARAAPPPARVGPGRWADALRRGRVAVGYELVGASAAMLELARVHALERVQFGQPIASFQAVRHRLADSFVAVESARALLDAAWDDADGETAAMAKALAGRSARSTARHAQQVLAGMGFTTEHPLHRYVRRILVLDALFGSARALTAALGRHVLAKRRLPAPVAL